MRIVIAIGLGIILIGGIYVFYPTLETGANMVLMARDVFFPSDDENANDAKVTPAVPPPAKSAALSGFAAKFGNSLMVMDGETPQNFDGTKLTKVKYYAFYYASSSNTDCITFTPQLVSFYRTFKSSHPEFEVIFVDFDHSEREMLDYMYSTSMGWPAVWYSDVDNPELDIKKYCGSALPCLVLTDDTGRVLSDTFDGTKYTDPHHVIDDIRAIVQ